MENIPIRWLRRAEPRFLVALAGAGCALVLAGSLLIGGDEAGGEDGSRAPGILLMAAVVAGGYVLLAKFREGPLGATGSLAVGVGVPALLYFVTYDGDATEQVPVDVILFGSTFVLLVSALVGPGRGRLLLLGLAAVGAWLFVLEITEDAGLFPVTFVWFGFLFPFFGDEYEPNLGAIGGLSLLFGAAYLVTSRVFDKRGWRGAAQPLLAVGLVATALGITFLGDDLNAGGAGTLGMVVGALLALHGADVGRRGTTWAGGAFVAGGVVAIATDMTEKATTGGWILIVAGIAIVVLAHALRIRIVERPEIPDEIPDPPPVREF